jgi:p-aminobenzoyl-glutamate transporter AbgT
LESDAALHRSFAHQKKAHCMKKMTTVFMILALATHGVVNAQCSICTKTASQLGRNSAEGLNGGIIYLMLIPFAIMGFVGLRWWRQERRVRAEEAR